MPNDFLQSLVFQVPHASKTVTDLHCDQRQTFFSGSSEGFSIFAIVACIWTLTELEWWNGNILRTDYLNGFNERFHILIILTKTLINSYLTIRWNHFILLGVSYLPLWKKSVFYFYWMWVILLRYWHSENNLLSCI